MKLKNIRVLVPEAGGDAGISVLKSLEGKVKKILFMIVMRM